MYAWLVLHVHVVCKSIMNSAQVTIQCPGLHFHAFEGHAQMEHNGLCCGSMAI